MVEIVIKKKRSWFSRKKWHAQIKHTNGNILFWSAKQINVQDLEEMIKNTQRDLSKAKITYDTDL